MRLFRAHHRKGQWNRMFNYSQAVQRRSPFTCWAISTFVLFVCFISYSYTAPTVTLAEAGLNDGENQRIFASIGRHLLLHDPLLNDSVQYNYKCQIVNTSSKTSVALDTCTFEKSTNVVAGWILAYVFVTIVAFIAMAIVCDDFFVPSLEVISEKLHLSDDVAGATFMAAGSSAPELFNSLAAVSFDSDAGVGTIVGSAVFNLLVAVALSAAFAGKVLHLDWRPVSRDTVWYLVSIVFYIYVMHDSIVQIWDAVGLLVLYILYIVIMTFNSTLMDGLARVQKRFNCPSASVDYEEVAVSAKSKDIEETEAKPLDRRERKEFRHDRSNTVFVGLLESRERGRSRTYSKLSEESSILEVHEAPDESRIFCCSCCACCPDIRGAPPEKGAQMSCSQWAVYVLKWIVFVLAFPFLCLFSWTIPECSRDDLKKYALLSFFTSLLWIAALSFCMVTSVARLGCLLGVDTFVMALVFLAAGTSVPDLLTSIIVAKDGYGDMAVSNAIGSNVFDIDLGLGLPFLIRLCINKLEPLDLFTNKERRYYCQHAMKMITHVKFGIVLVILLGAYILVFLIARFKLGRLAGVSFILLYIAFLVYAFLQQFLCTYNC